MCDGYSCYSENDRGHLGRASVRRSPGRDSGGSGIVSQADLHIYDLGICMSEKLEARRNETFLTRFILAHKSFPQGTSRK